MSRGFLFLIFLVPLYVLSAEEKQFPKAPEPLYSAVSEAISKRTWLSPVSLEKNEVPDNTARGLWSGSRVTPNSDLKEISLKFVLPDSEKANVINEGKDLTPDSFEFTLSFARSGLTMRHGQGSDKLSRGIRSNLMYAVPRPPVDLYFNGLGDSDLYVVLPVIKSPDFTYGVAICPRMFRRELDPKDKKTWRTNLVPSLFELKEGKVTLTSDFKGKMESSFQLGKINLDIIPSPGLPKARLGVNEDEEIDPKVELAYTPITPFDFFPIDLKNGTHEGIFTNLKMQNRAGYIKEWHFNHSVLINEIPPGVWSMKSVNGKAISEDRGNCFSVLVFKSLTEHFKHKDLL